MTSIAFEGHICARGVYGEDAINLILRFSVLSLFI